ncbi:MAG: peptidylprolyl isomerase [Chthonomonadales bacterium]
MRPAIALFAIMLGCSSPGRAVAGNPNVAMKIAGRGTVIIELFPKEAPKTVDHFLALVRKKFYDGILIHRVVPGFVVQAGDPATRKYTPEKLGAMSDEELAQAGIGGGGSGHNIPFEVNALTHETGTLGIALTAPRSATGDSQWFINLAPNHRLDGDYCVFGKVRTGMDVVNRIRKGDRIVSMREVTPPSKTSQKRRGKSGSAGR